MKTMLGIVMALVAVVSLVCGQDGRAAGEDGFRLVPVPKREHGYAGLESVVIGSQAEWDALAQKAQAGQGWNGGGKFLEAVQAAKLDFGREALVLLRHTEGSGSTQVELAKPKLGDGTLRCEIRRKPAGIGTADMAYYCFAVAVEKSTVQKVELRVAGRKPVVLPLGK